MFCIFSIYPFFKVFHLSLFEWRPPLQPVFVAFRNFADIFGDAVWWKSMLQAGYITILSLVIQNILALLLALAIARRIRCGNLYSVIFFIPPVLAGIVVGLIWKWIYNPNYGLLNHFLSLIGLENCQNAWLDNPNTALTCVAIIHMWKGFGWGFVILLAGLQIIPEELYEAARIDGASVWHRFRHITAPLMVPVFFLVSILTILGTMQIFDIIFSTTRGGPAYHTEVPITRILFSMQSSNYGYACTQGAIFGVILFVLSMVQLRISKQKGAGI
jgi:ABC-type sugar transport system permease subunit